MKFIAAFFILLLPFSAFAQEDEEEEEVEKPEKAWKKDTSFHKSRLAVKTDLFLQFLFTGADVEVCYPITKHIHANIDVIGSTNKFFPRLASRTYPSWTVIGELRYFFPQHSTFDGAFFGPYYRFKRGAKKYTQPYPVTSDDYYDIWSHTIGLVAGFSFQPRRFPHLIIEAHTGMGIAVELDIIRRNPRLPTYSQELRRNLTINERINPRAGFCIGYAF